MGVVIAQVGCAAADRSEVGGVQESIRQFLGFRRFRTGGRTEGRAAAGAVRRERWLPIHPVGFLVITKSQVYGLPISPEFGSAPAGRALTPAAFGLRPEQLELVRIQPQPHGQDGKRRWTSWAS